MSNRNENDDDALQPSAGQPDAAALLQMIQRLEQRDREREQRDREREQEIKELQQRNDSLLHQVSNLTQFGHLDTQTQERVRLFIVEQAAMLAERDSTTSGTTRTIVDERENVASDEGDDQQSRSDTFSEDLEVALNALARVVDGSSIDLIRGLALRRRGGGGGGGPSGGAAGGGDGGGGSTLSFNGTGSHDTLGAQAGSGDTSANQSSNSPHQQRSSPAEISSFLLSFDRHLRNFLMQREMRERMELLRIAFVGAARSHQQHDAFRCLLEKESEAAAALLHSEMMGRIIIIAAAAEQRPKVQPRPRPIQRPPRCRSVFVGINYVGGENPLHGAINDVCVMMKLATMLRFDTLDTRVLVEEVAAKKDDFRCRTDEPTSNNIQAALRWLASDVVAGDNLLFYYAGHAWRREKDGKAIGSGICPSTGDNISREWIFENLVKPLPAGCRLTVVLDCCFAAAVLNLPYQWHWDGQKSFVLPDLPKDFVPVDGKQPCAADVICLGGSDVHEQSIEKRTAAEIFTHEFHRREFPVNDKAGGAFTNVLAQTLSKAAGGLLVAPASIGLEELLLAVQKTLKEMEEKRAMLWNEKPSPWVLHLAASLVFDLSKMDMYLLTGPLPKL